MTLFRLSQTASSQFLFLAISSLHCFEYGVAGYSKAGVVGPKLMKCWEMDIT